MGIETQRWSHMRCIWRWLVGILSHDYCTFPIGEANLQGLSNAAGSLWHYREHDPQRGLLRQRTHGELLRALQAKCVERASYQTRSQARLPIFEYLEVFITDNDSIPH